MPIPIHFSSSADAWLDRHPRTWIVPWLFEIDDVPLGAVPIRGFVPAVFVVEPSKGDEAIRVTFARFPTSIKILTIELVDPGER